MKAETISAEIISVGTELLLGDVVNTDATAVARALTTIGVNLLYTGTVGDNPERLEQALQQALTRSDLVITTGGQGRDEWVPEGQAMRNYLIEKGLDSQRVLAECKSTSTEENFLFAKEILVQQGISAQEPVVYVTNAFHCYRGGVYAAMAGFTTAHALPAGIPLRSVLTCYLREAAAVIYYWLFKSSRTGFMQPLVGLLSLNKKFFYK